MTQNGGKGHPVGTQCGFSSMRTEEIKASLWHLKGIQLQKQQKNMAWTWKHVHGKKELGHDKMPPSSSCMIAPNNEINEGVQKRELRGLSKFTGDTPKDIHK